MKKYDFFSECGGVYLLTATVDNPQRYAELLASERGLPTDEVIFEQAGGTVADFDKFFPPLMTTGEKHRFEQLQAIETLLNEVNIPTMDGNTRLTISQRVKWLTSQYNQYEGRFLCPSCNKVWED